MNPYRNLFSWAVLAGVLALAGCQWGDIGNPNDMADSQELSLQHRPILKATEMPPGLGEDLPMASEKQPVAANRSP